MSVKSKPFPSFSPRVHSDDIHCARSLLIPATTLARNFAKIKFSSRAKSMQIQALLKESFLITFTMSQKMVNCSVHRTLSRRCRRPSVSRLLGALSRSLFYGMMTQAVGIRQMIYVIKPGPRLVGVTIVGFSLDPWLWPPSFSLAICLPHNSAGKLTAKERMNAISK